MSERLAIILVTSILGLAATGLTAFVWLLKAQHRMISNHMKHDFDATERNTTANNKLSTAIDTSRGALVDVTRSFTETMKDMRKDCVVRRGITLDS